MRRPSTDDPLQDTVANSGPASLCCPIGTARQSLPDSDQWQDWNPDYLEQRILDTSTLSSAFGLEVGFEPHIGHMATAMTRVSKEILVAKVKVQNLVQTRVRVGNANGEGKRAGRHGRGSPADLGAISCPWTSYQPYVPMQLWTKRSDNHTEAETHVDQVCLCVLVPCWSKQWVNHHRITCGTGQSGKENTEV